MNEERPIGRRLAQVLALNRTVGIVLLTVLFFGLGEQLWSQFMPVFLDAQTKELARDASASGSVSWRVLAVIGVYACLQNLFEGFCYIFGGQVTARLGDRGSLILFGASTVGGYLLFLSADSPVVTVIAALLIMAWEPLSVPVTFTTVGSTVGSNQRGMAFALQSIQKRVPKIVGPALGGVVLGVAERYTGDAEAGRIAGMRALVTVALVLGLVSVCIQLKWMPRFPPSPPGPPAATIVRRFHPVLRRLLLAEVFTRWCDWLVRQFVILYVVNVRGLSLQAIGLLFAVQNLTALLTYLPIGRLTEVVGLQPFVGLTFVFFALFPLMLAVVPDGSWLILAFVVYGLREIGEPARKALITSLLPQELRARGVGLYWGVRSFAMCAAPLVGAGLWYARGPQILLYAAFVLGCVGAAVFYVFCRTANRSDWI